MPAAVEPQPEDVAGVAQPEPENVAGVAEPEPEEVAVAVEPEGPTVIAVRTVQPSPLWAETEEAATAAESEPEEVAVAVELEEPTVIAVRTFQPSPLWAEPEERTLVAVRTFQPSPLWAETSRAAKPAETPEPPSATHPAGTDQSLHGREPYEELTRLATVHAIAHTTPSRQEVGRPAPAEAAIAEAAIAEATLAEEAALADASAPADTPPSTSEPDHPTPDETPWPVGERRSAARQARKPLPAALQAAVASGVTKAAAETSAPPQSDAKQPAGATDGPKTESGAAAGSGKPPGLFRRYGSAIVVVALFIAAGAAAIGIAWARGPVGQKVSPTPAQDQAAADKVVLGAGDFPPGWLFSKRATSASSYGVGAMFVTPSVVNSWLVGRPQCVSALNDLRTAMASTAGSPTAVASSQATAVDGLGGSWQIADAVTFRATAAQLTQQSAAMNTVLSSPHAMACISSFWRSGLLAELPHGSHVVTSVTRMPVPVLPGNPPVWAISMTSTATVGNRSLPIQFGFTTFTSGLAQISLASSGKLVALNAGLDRTLLKTLATRAEHLAS